MKGVISPLRFRCVYRRLEDPVRNTDHTWLKSMTHLQFHVQVVEKKNTVAE